MGLMRRIPPKHTDTALSALLSLLPHHSSDLLSQVDQPLQVSPFYTQPDALLFYSLMCTHATRHWVFYVFNAFLRYLGLRVGQF